MSFRREIEFRVGEELELVDLTTQVKNIVEDSGVKDGICLVYSPGSTGALFINEYESSLLEDFKDLMKSLVKDIRYKHPANARSHLRTILTGNQQVIPIKDGKLELGVWQKIIFCNFDIKGRGRKVIVQVIG